MPIYVYEKNESEKGCEVCTKGFERAQSIRDAPLAACPECGAPVHRVPVLSAVGFSQSSLDDRAKAAGFSKLKRLGKGEYEKEY